MSDNGRHFLYFALGLLPQIFFGARFFVQWLTSERAKKSLVNSLFWRLSITGNLLFALHYLIQFQYQFLFIQSINAFIAWRNLNFIKKGERALSFTQAILILCMLIGLMCSLCMLQNSFLQAPLGILQTEGVSLWWHIFGLFGGLLFASRFWVQWVEVERRRESQLTKSFWILSVVGSLFALIYFIRILDWVNIVSYSIGLVPYIRNLMLMRRVRQPEL